MPNWGTLRMSDDVWKGNTSRSSAGSDLCWLAQLAMLEFTRLVRNPVPPFYGLPWIPEDPAAASHLCVKEPLDLKHKSTHCMWIQSDPDVVGSCHFFEPIQIRSPSTATKGSTPVNHIWGHFVCLLISALAVLCPGRPEFDGFPYHMKSAIHLFTMDASFFIWHGQKDPLHTSEPWRCSCHASTLGVSSTWAKCQHCVWVSFRFIIIHLPHLSSPLSFLTSFQTPWYATQAIEPAGLEGFQFFLFLPVSSVRGSGKSKLNHGIK